MTETNSTNALSKAGRVPGWNVVGWSIYLAMSWTWCIGMFLPVLIMRELGFVGVITFAAPNILGAAALAWVIRDGDQSRAMIRDHRRACVWFSLVTIVYHSFFAAWMIRKIAGPNAGAEVVAVFLAFWVILRWRRGGEFLSVILCWRSPWGSWDGDSGAAICPTSPIPSRARGWRRSITFGSPRRGFSGFCAARISISRSMPPGRRCPERNRASPSAWDSEFCFH